MRGPNRAKMGALVVAAVFAAGCGGGSDAGADGLEPGMEGALDALVIGDGDVDIDEDGSVEVSMGDENNGAVMGEDLAPPDWLPPGFPLPDDYAIGRINWDGDVRTISGVWDRDLPGARSDLLSWFVSEGYEVLEDDTANGSLEMVAATDAGAVVDVKTFAGQLEFTFSNRDVSSERFRASPLIEGPGSATVSVAGENFTVEGECRVQVPTYSFSYFSKEGSRVTVEFDLSAFDPPSGSAFVAREDHDGLAAGVVARVPSESDVPTEYSHTDTGATISGLFVPQMGEGESFEGSVSIDCG